MVSCFASLHLINDSELPLMVQNSLQTKPGRLLTLKTLFPLPVHRDFGKFAFSGLKKNYLDLQSSGSGGSARITGILWKV